MTNGSIITNNGKKIILDRTFNSSPTLTVPSTYKIGINNSTPSVSDTDIVRPFPIDSTEQVQDCDDYTEFASGTDTTLTQNTTNLVQGTGSISMAKSGTSGTVMSMSDTIASPLDFTSKDLWVYIKITDVTDLVSSGTAITIRYGSDSSNYYYYNIDVSSLSNGGNWIVFNTTTATGTTSSPTITACDYIYIAFNTDLAADTIAADRVLIDDFKLASSNDYVGSYVSGYPIYDFVTRQVTVRALLNSVQGNGANLNAFGLYNTDGTPLMFYEMTHTDTSKDNTDEFAYLIKFKAT